MTLDMDIWGPYLFPVQIIDPRSVVLIRRVEKPGPFCECDLDPSFDELESGRCACCGKPLFV